MKSTLTIAVAGVATTLMLPAAAWAAVTFAPAVHVPAGDGPSATAVGDLNGDGKPDLVTGNADSNSVSVLLGNGVGGFAPAVQYPAGPYVTSVVIADLSGDGKPDLAAANFGTTAVSILLGNGDGTFAARFQHPVGLSPSSVAVDDFNGDGDLDFVTANSADTNVSVVLGNGDGTFGPRINYAAGAEATAVVIGDLNGDGKADLVTANPVSTRVNVLLGNGDGTFGPPATPYGGDYPQSVALGDLNGDGNLDLVVSNPTTNTVGVLLGTGDGGFGSPTNYPAGNGTTAVAIGDLDGDGKPDLAAANLLADSVSVLTGDGDGAFTLTSTEPVGDAPTAVAIADLNGDGRSDVATANANTDNVSILWNASVWTFTTGPTATISGTVAQGETLTADEGSPDPTPDSFTYEWLADGVAIGGATAKTLVLGPGQVGKKISVTVTAKKAGYDDASDTSDETATVAGIFTTGPTASISGTVRQGQTLTADEGSPDPTPDSFTYEWLADGVAIGGATAKTFELTSAEVGKKISVTVTAKKAGLADASHTSPETVPVEGIFTPGPTASISGLRRVGSTLTANTGSPSPVPDSFAYRWFLDGQQLGTKTKTLKLGAGTAGKPIRVKVYAIKAGYLTAADLSAATAPISNLQAKTISMELNDYTVVRGQRVYAEIELLAPNEPFSIVLDGTKLASGYANTKGVAVKAFTVPANATIGPRILRAYGKFTDRTDPDPITIR